VDSVGAGGGDGVRVTSYHSGDSIGGDYNYGGSVVVIQSSGAVVRLLILWYLRKKQRNVPILCS